jgi:hypothetical protein
MKLIAINQDEIFQKQLGTPLLTTKGMKKLRMS